MLELIFQGFVEWMYGLVLEAWEYFSSVLLDLMSLDFQYLRTHMPIIDTVMQIMLAVGWALLIGNLVFQAVRSMASGLGFEAEDPKMLFTRTFVFSFLLLASPQICQIGLNMTSTVIDYLEMPDAVNITFVDEASFGGMAAAWLLVVISGIIVMFQTFKLIMEMAERYFILAMLTITAPLAFGMGGSRNTSDIFSGWCRMFGSMCLLMALNVVFMKMLLSVLSVYPSGLDVLPWMVLVVTIVKVAKKADGILSRIGLNPAMTGDSLGHGMPGALAYSVIRSMASNVARTISKGGNGGKAGTQGGTTNPRNGGPAGAHAGTTANHTQNRNQSSASSQTSVRAGTAQEKSQSQTAQQNTATQQETVQSMANQAGTTVTSNMQAAQTNLQNHTSRNSSVPHGSRRGTSHVKPQSTAKNASVVSTTVRSNVQHASQGGDSSIQQHNHSAAVIGAAAVAAGAVVQGAGSAVQHGANAVPSASKPIKRATQPSLHAGTSTSAHAQQNTSIQGSRAQQQSTQNTQHVSGSPVQSHNSAVQEYSAPQSVQPTSNAAGIPAQAGMASVSPPVTEKSAVPNGAAGSEPIQAPTARSTGAAPSIGGRYTQQEAQGSRVMQHNQTNVSSAQQSQRDTRHSSEARSTNREQSASTIQANHAQTVMQGATVQTVRQAAQPNVAPQGAPAPPVHASNAHHSVHRSEPQSTQQPHTVGSQPASNTQATVQTEQRSTQRPAGSPYVGQTTPAPQESRAQQHPGINAPAPGSTQQTTVQSEQRSTQRQNNAVQQNVGHTSATVQNTAVTQTQSVQAEARSTQRPAASVPQEHHRPAGGIPGVSAAPSQTAPAEARSTQRPTVPAAQEVQPVQNHSTPNSMSAQPAPAEARSTQRIPTPVTGTGSTTAETEPRSTTRPAQPDAAVHHSSPVQEPRSTQRPAQSVPIQPKAAPVPSAVSQGASVNSEAPQVARQSRNPAPPAVINTGGQPSTTVRQENREPGSASRPSSAKPIPTARQEQPIHSSQSTLKHEAVPVPHPGTAGMGHYDEQRTVSTPGSSVKQEQNSTKKPFVPLTGKQPESIPSHLDLKQEPQKTTKRPAETEVGHVTE